MLLVLAVSAAENYDVVVFAATPGGVMAAVAAARSATNMSVALLEPGLYVGGTCFLDLMLDF